MNRVGLGVDITRGGPITSIGRLLFTASEPGLWLDPSDLTTLFQDTAGTQPVTTAGQTVALALDKSKGLVLGPELVTNGAFDTDTAWTKGAGWTIAGGVASFTATGSISNLSQASILPSVGATVRVTVTLTRSAGAIGIYAGLSATPFSVSASGTYTFLATVTGNTTFYAQAGTTFTGTIDNISVRELSGNHATQSILASRPLYALHPSSGIRNLANGSADVGNAAYWLASQTVNGVTYTRVATGIDTDGLPYADYSAVGTATTLSEVFPYVPANSRISAAVGNQITVSFLARVISGTPPTGGSGARADVVGETAPNTFTEIGASAVFSSTT